MRVQGGCRRAWRAMRVWECLGGPGVGLEDLLMERTWKGVGWSGRCWRAWRVREALLMEMTLEGSLRVWEGLDGSGRVWDGMTGSERVSESLGGFEAVI
jgi:hypothetical protein